MNFTKAIPGEELFRLHVQEGFSLTDSLLLCLKEGDMPIWSGWFKAARTENKRSGFWDFDKACDVIEEAIQDSTWPQPPRRRSRPAAKERACR